MAEQDQKQPESESRAMEQARAAGDRGRSEAVARMPSGGGAVPGRAGGQLQEEAGRPGMRPCGPRPMPRTSSAARSRTWKRPANLPWSSLPGVAAGGGQPGAGPGGRAGDDEVVKPIAEGVELTLKSFLDALKKFNIEVVDPQGEPFDPNLHQAMSMVENNEVEPNTVIAVMQKGYTLNGRLVRPAMVMVSKSGGASARIPGSLKSADRAHIENNVIESGGPRPPNNWR